MVDDRSYGSLLGEYLSVVNELESVLDETGRPSPEAREEHQRLRAEKAALREALEATDLESRSEVEEAIEGAFED